MNNRRKLIIGGFALLVCSMIFKGIMQQPQIYANKQRIAELEEKIAYEKTRQIEKSFEFFRVIVAVLLSYVITLCILVLISDMPLEII